MPFLIIEVVKLVIGLIPALFLEPSLLALDKLDRISLVGIYIDNIFLKYKEFY